MKDRFWCLKIFLEEYWKWTKNEEISFNEFDNFVINL